MYLKIDYKTANNLLEVYRQQSIDYLTNSIENK